MLVDAFIIYFIITLMVICVIAVIYAIMYNKFNEINIRIDEAEANIDNILRAKYDALNRAIAIIRGNVEINEEVFEEIVKLRSRKISNFALDRKLVDASNEFFKLGEQYKDLYDSSDELKKIVKLIKNSDEKLFTLKEYFNSSVSKYNILVKSFPTNVVALLSKYKEKLFFDKKDMTDDDYNDFKL